MYNGVFARISPVIRGLMLMALALMAFAPRHAQAAQSYHGCTGFVTSLPVVIDTPGTWCLKQDLATAITSGNAITLNSDNVVLDCNGFSLDGRAGGVSAWTYGVQSINHRKETVRNCHIQGFFFGVGLYQEEDRSLYPGNVGHVIEDNFFEANTSIGTRVDGDGSIVRRNRFRNIAGSTISSSFAAIQTSFSVDVLDNDIFGVAASENGSAEGISVYANTSGSINGNRIHGLVKGAPAGAYSGAAEAININGSGRIVVRNNDLSGDTSDFNFGLSCQDSLARISNNVIGGFSVPVHGCGDAGGNDITP